MSARRAILLGIVLLALGASVVPAVGQGGDNIIVNGADGVWTRSVSITQDLTNRLANVAPRVVLESVNQVRHIRLNAPPASLQTLLGQVPARVILLYANAVRHQRLVYPVALFHDTTPPQITSLAAAPMGGDKAKITWTTNEFATSEVLYGTQSGVYPYKVSDPLYTKQHEVTLTGLTPGTKYYYKVRSTDRSGNTATSAEYNFTVQIHVYLPLVLRNYR
jgi:hypothetical protein